MSPVEAPEKDIRTESKIATSSKGWAFACTVALLGYGVFLRVWEYSRNYSLNHDEAALALNLIHRSAAQLCGPLDYLQAAPLGFLLVERRVLGAAGAGEYSLRLFPLMCSIAALCLFWVWIRSRVNGPAQIAAVGFFAVSQNLISMSPRVKQYSTEVLAAILFLVIGEWLLQENPSRRRLAVSATLGAVLLWFSFSAVFMMAAVATACILFALRERAVSVWRNYIVVFSIWGASLALLLFSVMRMGGAKASLVQFWESNYVPLANPRLVLPWFWESLGSLGASVTSVRLAPVATIAMIVGIVMAIRSRDYMRIALAASIGWCLTASAMRQYPFVGRFLFFLVPVALVLVFEPLSRLRRRNWKNALLVISMLALTYASVSAAKNLVFRKLAPEDDPRAVLIGIRQRWQPADKVYLSSGSTPPFLYYKDLIGFHADDFVTGRKAESLEFGPTFTKMPVSGGRVWFMYLPQLDGAFDREALSREGRWGRELQSIDGGFYAAKLWEVEP